MRWALARQGPVRAVNQMLRIVVAKNQNTFEKRRREFEKKRKAEEKREIRRKKKEQAPEDAGHLTPSPEEQSTDE